MVISILFFQFLLLGKLIILIKPQLYPIKTTENHLYKNINLVEGHQFVFSNNNDWKFASILKIVVKNEYFYMPKTNWFQLHFFLIFISAVRRWFLLFFIILIQYFLNFFKKFIYFIKYFITFSQSISYKN